MGEVPALAGGTRPTGVLGSVCGSHEPWAGCCGLGAAPQLDPLECALHRDRRGRVRALRPATSQDIDSAFMWSGLGTNGHMDFMSDPWSSVRSSERQGREKGKKRSSEVSIRRHL